MGKAIRQRMKILGFSSHAPVPFPTTWTMKPYNLKQYCKSIRSLKQNNRSTTEIFLGLEIDFIPGIIGPHSPEFTSLGLDYIIGSVHFAGRLNTERWWTIDGSEETFAMGIEETYRGDIRKAVETYYRLVQQMTKEQPPDIIGHLDVIKKNNREEKYFSEDETWYREIVFVTLEVIAESGAIVEVNTGGIARRKITSLYPSRWILKRCLELGIPITLNSDAHNPEHIMSGFNEAANVLQDIGFKYLHILDSEGWHPCTFSTAGLKC